MAYDLAMNINTNDLILTQNDAKTNRYDLLLIDNAERVAQQILITLRFWYGEWFLDTSQGVPYLEYILVKNPNIAHIRQILREQITSVEGAITLDSLELDYNIRERSLFVEYAVTTNYGLITRKEVLGYGG